MPPIYITTLNSPYGPLIIGDHKGQLCLLDWQYRARRRQIDNRICSLLNAEYVERSTSLHEVVTGQLYEYFEGRRAGFDLPLLFAGTAFQQNVWHNLLNIRYGETISYLELGRRTGNEKSIRAAAAANGANAISIVVPCHRVTGSKGELTGYAGGIHVKQQLLRLEYDYQRPNLFSPPGPGDSSGPKHSRFKAG